MLTFNLLNATLQPDSYRGLRSKKHYSEWTQN